MLKDELGLNEVQARAALGGLAAVVVADGPPRANGARLLAVAAEALGLAACGDVPPADAAAIGAAFPTAEARGAVICALILGACIEGEVTARGEAVVVALARQLDVRSHWVELLPALRRRATFAVKRQLVRRSPDARRIFARVWAEEGMVGIFRALLFVMGRYREPALAARFRALAALAPGTVGRTFFDALSSQGFAFPGERGGMPERMVHHDLMHVINRYGTDAAGECELAGFYAGFADGDAFTFVMTVLATFHLGMKVSPAVVVPAKLAFDPARVLAAYLRGRRLCVDVMGPWDYWALMPLPIDEAQRRLGLLPEAGRWPTMRRC